MTKLIKDTSLFAVYDPDTGRENLYQYSADELFKDISFTIENELNDYLSVVVDPISFSFPGGHLILTDNVFHFTPASIPEFYAENQVKLLNNYVDYLGDPVAGNLGDTQEDINLHFTPVVNTNELFRRALNVDPTNSFGITYDDPDSPNHIVSIRAESFVANDHPVPDILRGVRFGEFSDASTVNDLLLIRDTVNNDVNLINENIQGIVDYIRSTENLNRGGDYLVYPDSDTYTDVTDTSSGLIPSRQTIQIPGNNPDGSGTTTDITSPTIVLSWEDAVDKSYTNVSRVRIHEFVTRDFNFDEGTTTESKYNYSKYITGSYISLEDGDNTFLYEIVSHIPGTEPLTSAKHEIGSTGEYFYQFGVVSVQSTNDIVQEPIIYTSVRLFTEETGINVGEADQRYVIASGDSMTGTLSFSKVAQPISISDDTSTTLTVSVDGTATQTNANANLLEGNLVNRKNLTDAIDASELESDGKFVKLVGDTMTGQLIMDKTNIEVNEGDITVNDGSVLVKNGNLEFEAKGDTAYIQNAANRFGKIVSRAPKDTQVGNTDFNSAFGVKVDLSEGNSYRNNFVVGNQHGDIVKITSGTGPQIEFATSGFTPNTSNTGLTSGIAIRHIPTPDFDKSPPDIAVNKKYVDTQVATVKANLNTDHKIDTVDITNTGGDGCTIEGASETLAGVVTTSAQVFTGTKTFKTDSKAIDIHGSIACQGDEGTSGYVLTSKGVGNKVEWTPANGEPGVPKGIVMFWPMAKSMIPTGWYALDGSTHSIDPTVDINFASLHQTIQGKLNGYTYDATTGTLPDWSDRFAGQTGNKNGSVAGEFKGSMTKRPTTEFTSNGQSHSHDHNFSMAHGHGNSFSATTNSGGIHKHTISNDLYVNKDNSKSNTGNQVNYCSTNYNSGGSRTLTTDDMASSAGHTHTVSITGSVTNYSDPATKKKTENQSTSHTHKITGGGDAVTRPESVIGYWIIRS